MASQRADTSQKGMQALKLVIGVLAILSTVSYASQWYAQKFSMPRYCAEPGRYIERVAEIINNTDLMENDSRREYLVAAKLNYLAPRQSAEPLDSYLKRLRSRLEETCS